MLAAAALHDRNIDRAIAELMQNARLLTAAGFPSDAYRALELLLEPGVWRLPARGALVHHLQRLLAPVALLADMPCPSVGDQPAISLEQLSTWAEHEADRQLRSAAIIGRSQQRPAGLEWSSAFLSTLVDRVGEPSEPRRHLAFGAFSGDAEVVLKARVAQRFGCSTSAVQLPFPSDLTNLGLDASVLAQLVEQFQGAGAIEVAPYAQNVDTLEVLRAIDAYLRSTGFAGGYLTPTYLAGWLLLVDEGRDADAVEAAAAWICQDNNALACMIDLAPVPSVSRFLRSGKLASSMRIDAEGARAWVSTLSSRAMTQESFPLAPIAALQPESLQEFLSKLQGSSLHGHRWHRVQVPDSDEIAWATSIPVATRKSSWDSARAIVERTGRWPVVTTLWGDANSEPEPESLAEDLFSRFHYGEGPARDDVTPRSYIATSQGVDVVDFLAELSDRAAVELADRIEDWKHELERAGLPVEGLEQALLRCSNHRLCVEKCIADQEAEMGLAKPEIGRQSGFEPDNAWLVLLPSPHGEHTLAYMHWYAILQGHADGYIALLRAWREKYGAELFAHYGTMLEFVVRRPPEDMSAAMELALEHELAAPCTLFLRGIPLRHHALGLLGFNEWFLHERP